MAVLVSDIQRLVTCVRNNSDVGQITDQVDSIADIVGKVISETDKNGYRGYTAQLSD
ncbi:component of the polarisome [Purpureocillium takamizusanense]|uniref:Component of the polarisome n=1 Tax=Purpureocillium takamizusanense TaxID=2060973 RepID=A0A9Q8VFL9_9HYPO|nr:component of the polarisome [Purpureocillium takamizusanense]UNI23586.1 component of the polarisome [Purpureocillium takamizusanense]